VAARSKIIGLGQLDAALKAKAALLHAATVTAVMLETKAVQGDAINDAPVDSGELASSIKARTNGASGTVEAQARHAAFLEFGTSRTPAQPYMGPAAAKSRSRYVGRMSAAVRRAVA
jgi:HK97 gp10 family phage protein